VVKTLDLIITVTVRRLLGLFSTGIMMGDCWQMDKSSWHVTSRSVNVK